MVHCGELRRVAFNRIHRAQHIRRRRRWRARPLWWLEMQEMWRWMLLFSGWLSQVKNAYHYNGGLLQLLWLTSTAMTYFNCYDLLQLLWLTSNPTLSYINVCIFFPVGACYDNGDCKGRLHCYIRGSETASWDASSFDIVSLITPMTQIMERAPDQCRLYSIQ